jgi:hypothetical protein
MNDTQDTSLSAVYAETPGGLGCPEESSRARRRLQAHAEQTDNVCVLEGIALRQRQLSPDQYEIVEVRTSRGVLRTALLIPKAVLKALWEAELPFREALGIKRERKQLRRSK